MGFLREDPRMARRRSQSLGPGGCWERGWEGRTGGPRGWRATEKPSWGQRPFPALPGQSSCPAVTSPPPPQVPGAGGEGGVPGQSAHLLHRLRQCELGGPWGAGAGCWAGSGCSGSKHRKQLPRTGEALGPEKRGEGELMGQKQTEQILWDAAEASAARVSTAHSFPPPRAKPGRRKGRPVG